MHKVRNEKIDENNYVKNLVQEAKFIASNLRNISKLNSEKISFGKMLNCARKFEHYHKHFRCSNRLCLVCGKMQQLRLSDGYIKSVYSLKQPFFLTLTLPPVYIDEDINLVLNEMTSNFTKIKNVLKKQHTPLIGLKKLEIVIHSMHRYYTPHYHLIMNSENTAEHLIKQWLKRFPRAMPNAQKKEQIFKGDEMKVLRYLTKPWFKIDHANPNFNLLLELYRKTEKRRKIQNYGGFTKSSYKEEKNGRALKSTEECVPH